MRIRLYSAALATAVFSTSAAAQAPVAAAFRDFASTEAKNLLQAAKDIPEAKYSYKPTPAQMSVGDIVTHLSGGNDYLCSKISGAAAPKRAERAKGAAKEALVGRLKETFQFCESALAKVNDSNLAAKVPFFGDREVTRAHAMFAAVEDWGDHYSQLAVYLRLNGLLPPTAKRGQE